VILEGPSATFSSEVLVACSFGAQIAGLDCLTHPGTNEPDRRVVRGDDGSPVRDDAAHHDQPARHLRQIRARSRARYAADPHVLSARSRAMECEMCGTKHELLA
jgi:hypothetical protein